MSPELCLTVGVYGVLRAGRGGGLGAVAAGAVQRVPAAPRRVRGQRSQGQGQLVLGRSRLSGEREGERPGLKVKERRCSGAASPAFTPQKTGKKQPKMRNKSEKRVRMKKRPDVLQLPCQMWTWLEPSPQGGGKP